MFRRRVGVLALVVLVLVPLSARAQRVPAPNDGAEESAPGPVASGGAPGPAPTAAPAAAVDQPFKRLLPNFWHDLSHFPSVDTAIVLGVGGVLSASATNYDEKWTEHASAGGEDPAYTAGGALGSGFTQFGIAIGTYAVGRLADHERTAHVGADLIRAQILSGVLTRSLKLIAQRARPADEQEEHTNTSSFPSGHSSAAWTTATVLWRHLGWKAGVPASLLASFVSASRLQQNAHYMSDVLFGAAIGVASARTVTFGHGERQVTIAPAPVAGGAALLFTLQPD